MNEELAIDAAINLVPQWTYQSSGGYVVKLNSKSKAFTSFRSLTPDLSKLFHSINENLPRLFSSIKNLSSVTGFEVIQEYFILEFLKSQSDLINWEKIIDYEKESSKRTYENQPISFNFILTNKTGSGKDDVFDLSIQKYFDSLTSAHWSYFEVDKDLNFIDYKQISWSDIQEPKEYQFYPEFLQPYMNINKISDTFSIHKTKRGDFIILDKYGLVAAKRKGQWKAYDASTLKNSIVDILKDYRVGANLFEIVFDLSFKRHGALLIFDPANIIANHIVNQESIVSSPHVDKARRILKSAAAKISIGAAERVFWNKSILEDLASIDGAIVFNSGKVIAIGAIIKSHPLVSGIAGARTIAAVSAMKYGACSIKISADGQIVFYFQKTTSTGIIESELEIL